MADNTPTQTFNYLAELGTSGLNRYSGYLQEELEPALQGFRWRKVCKQMQTDTVIGALLFAFEHLIRQVDFTFVAADDSPKAREYRDFYTDALFNDMSRGWKDTLSEIVTFLPWGFAGTELIYKRRLGENSNPSKRSKFTDGRIGWRKIALRAQETIERWEFDENDGGIKGMWQLAPPDWKYRYIPIEKMLLFRTTLVKDSPEGRSILRNAWMSWFYRTNIQRFEGIGIERNLSGLPVMKIPASILNADDSSPEAVIRNAYLNIVTNVRKDEQMGLLLPSDRDASGNPLYEFSLLNAPTQAGINTEVPIQRYDQRILMSVMADFLIIGHQSVGSFALSSSKTEMFSSAIGSFLDIICDTFNKHAIPRLAKLNGFQSDLLPSLHHGDIETSDLNELGAYVERLTKAGALTFPTQSGQIENHLMKQASFPTADQSPEEITKQHQEAVEKRQQMAMELMKQNAEMMQNGKAQNGQPSKPATETGKQKPTLPIEKPSPAKQDG